MDFKLECARKARKDNVLHPLLLGEVDGPVRKRLTRVASRALRSCLYSKQAN